MREKKTSKYVGQYVIVLEFFGISLVFLSATSWSATVLSFLSTITWGLPFEDGGKITYLPQDICIIKWKTLVGAEGYIGGRGGGDHLSFNDTCLLQGKSTHSFYYSCHVMSNHNTTLNFDCFLGSFLCQEHFRYVYNIKVTIKNSS